MLFYLVNFRASQIHDVILFLLCNLSKGLLLRELLSIESPLRLRRKVMSLVQTFRRKGGKNLFDVDLSEKQYKIMRRVYADEESKLMALRLGDVGDSQDEAWDSDEDPFVHLSADERQKIMKKMSIEEITEAGSNYKRLMMKLQKRKGFKRQKFKSPSL